MINVNKNSFHYKVACFGNWHLPLETNISLKSYLLDIARGTLYTIAEWLLAYYVVAGILAHLITSMDYCAAKLGIGTHVPEDLVHQIAYTFEGCLLLIIIADTLFAKILGIFHPGKSVSVPVVVAVWDAWKRKLSVSINFLDS